MNGRMVLFSYKMALDQFILISMFYLNDGVYELYAPITFFLIGLGFVLHLSLLMKEFRDKRREKEKKQTNTQRKEASSENRL